MEGGCSSEILVNIYQITRGHKPEDSNLRDALLQLVIIIIINIIVSMIIIIITFIRYNYNYCGARGSVVG
jgi:hypothetical protein